MDRNLVLKEVNTIKKWRHQIELPHDIVTPGFMDHKRELSRLELPQTFEGQSVIDIGCSDGYYSFLAEKRGASGVLGVDDMSSMLAGGINGFTVAKKILGSKVDYKKLSVDQLNRNLVGTFDHVIFLNVLYHLKHPLMGLQKIFRITKPGGYMYLKTLYDYDISVKFGKHKIGWDIGRAPNMKLYPRDGRSGDGSNWWVPNVAGVKAMLTATNWIIESESFKSHDRIYLKCRRPG